jgi:hypothetical protein
MIVDVDGIYSLQKWLENGLQEEKEVQTQKEESYEEIEKRWDETLTKFIYLTTTIGIIMDKYDFNFEELSDEEKKECLLKAMEMDIQIMNDNIKLAKAQRDRAVQLYEDCKASLKFERSTIEEVKSEING